MGISLLKKLFCRKDYVEIIPAGNPEFDNKNINSFLEKILDEKGIIIKIQGIEYHYTINGSENYYGEPGIHTVSENRYLLHYKCHKKIVK